MEFPSFAKGTSNRAKVYLDKTKVSDSGYWEIHGQIMQEEGSFIVVQSEGEHGQTYVNKAAIVYAEIEWLS